MRVQREQGNTTQLYIEHQRQYLKEQSDTARPEDYSTEGCGKEFVPQKRPQISKQKDAKTKRKSGQENVSVATNKQIAVRKEHLENYVQQLEMTKGTKCILQCCRSAFAKGVTSVTHKCRSMTKQYFLSVDHGQIPVCKIFFFNILGLSEQVAYPALNKVTQ